MPLVRAGSVAASGAHRRPAPAPRGGLQRPQMAQERDPAPGWKTRCHKERTKAVAALNVASPFAHFLTSPEGVSMSNGIATSRPAAQPAQTRDCRAEQRQRPDTTAQTRPSAQTPERRTAAPAPVMASPDTHPPSLPPNTRGHLSALRDEILKPLAHLAGEQDVLGG